MARRDVYLCKPERTEALRDELSRRFPDAALKRVDGRVDVTDGAPNGVAVAFASQVLPDVQPIQGDSINALASAAGEALAKALDAHSGPWRLHAFGLGEASHGRAKLVAKALDEWLSKKRRALRRTRNADVEGAWQPDEALVQLALESHTHALISVALPVERQRLRHALSTFIAGRCAVARDKKPPSRAYQKLLEAEKRLHRPIGANESLVDLGASPGGWSYVALERGARVTAIDRSPLRDDLMRNKKLTFVKADAFAWKPRERVDWLVCDLIAFPERTLELVEDWLGERRCRRFVVTMKFRGTEDYARVDALADLLHKHASDFQLRALDANKNEVTALGTVAPDAPRAILFDLDGVLVKSWEAWFKVVEEAGVHFRGRAVTREEFAPTFGQGTTADVKAFGFNLTSAQLDAFYAEHFGKYAAHVWVNPEAAPLLKSLRARGLKLAVVTNTMTPLAHEILRAGELDALFDFVACADRVPHAKPAPDLVLHACEKLGVATKDAWMIGDSRFDRGAANAAGVRFVGLELDGDSRVESLSELGENIAQLAP
ncbi:MAG: HAD-IA family hydrolase [Deltaproteobacteria bacterium]|nr:HAD-IA family hydrolase [Deltaproteobacteria bacterium]